MNYISSSSRTVIDISLLSTQMTKHGVCTAYAGRQSFTLSLTCQLKRNLTSSHFISQEHNITISTTIRINYCHKYKYTKNTTNATHRKRKELEVIRLSSFKI